MGNQTQTRTPPSQILRQWQARLRDGLDGLASTDPRRRTVEAVQPDGDETKAAWLTVDWGVRTLTPAWLDAAGLSKQAEILRTLPPVTSSAEAATAQDVVEQVTAGALDAVETERDRLREACELSRSTAIVVEQAANAGERAVVRRSCGQLVMVAASSIDLVAAHVAASALRVAKSAAQAITWRCVATSEDIDASHALVVDALLGSAVELVTAMGAVAAAEDSSAISTSTGDLGE